MDLVPKLCCGGGIRSGNGHKDHIVDIERLLVDYAWKELADPSLLDRLLKHKRYQVDVNWSYLDISHRVISFKPRKRGLADLSVTDSGSCNVTELESVVGHRDLCLFRTEFVNSSLLPQYFTFKTERTTTSRCHVSLQRGFRIGTNVDVRISLPVVSLSVFYLQKFGEVWVLTAAAV